MFYDPWSIVVGIILGTLISHSSWFHRFCLTIKDAAEWASLRVPEPKPRKREEKSRVIKA